MKSFYFIFLIFSINVINTNGLQLANKYVKDAQPYGDKLSFASYYGDNMVLQGSPYQATIWGHAPNNTRYGLVNIVIYPKLYTYVATVQDDFTWSLVVGPFDIHTPVRIEATLGEDSVSINNVLFGDIWVCSGQSNMAFALSQVFNASAELKDSLNYPDIRVFELNLITSEVPLTDLHDDGVMVPWSIPNPENLGGKPFTHFSAVCWLYGKYLYQTLKKPIGLIDTSWGGTPVEAWSSADALKQCGLSTTDKRPERGYKSEDGFDGPQDATQIWNAMVNPLLKMTIYGAIWYQGENNAHRNKHLYNCTFPAMIDDWRQKFHKNGETDRMFPFGFVQLAPYHGDYTEDTGFPEIRWHQTADYGFVPNYRQKNVFMAVAVDLPDFASPYDGIHPRDKQDVALRLARGGLALGYGYNISFQGPYPVKLYIHENKGGNSTQIDIEYTMNVQQRWTEGFEICCSYVTPGACIPGQSWWIPASTQVSTDRDNTTITKASTCDINQIVGLRYLWRDSPCNFKKCSIYGADNDLPLPPFSYSGKNFRKVRVDKHKYIVKL